MLNNDSDLWARVIQSIHGRTGRDISSFANSKKSGVWLNIVKSGTLLHNFNLNLEEYFTRSADRGEIKYTWKGDPSGIFSVKSLRLILDNVINSPFAGAHYWNKWLPPRVNCFVWRLLLNRIPTRVNLHSRGLNIPSEVCPLCVSNVETVEHLFLSCPAIKKVWDWFHKWCNLHMVQYNSLEQLIF